MPPSWSAQSTKVGIVVNALQGENYPNATRSWGQTEGKVLFHHEDINLTLADAPLRSALHYGSAIGRSDKV
jgi:hypothetical protein